MKSKQKKPILFFIAIIALFALFIGGRKMSQAHQHAHLVEIAHSEEVRQIIEGSLKHLDSNALNSEGVIQSYQIQDDKIEVNPMGGIMIFLIINKKQYYNVTIYIDKTDQSNTFESNGIDISGALSALLKGR